MRTTRWQWIFGFGCLVLAGCTAQTQNPAGTLDLLRTGEPLLRCREPCLAEWRQAQPQAAQLDAAGRWQELAALVLRVGYQDDLSLYYLGRAAEGIGYPGAAASYYRQSTYLSGTSISCAVLSRQCGGLSFPRSALMRLAVIERELARQSYRRARPSSPGREVPVSAPAETAPSLPSETAAPARVEPAPAPEPNPAFPPAAAAVPPPSSAPASAPATARPSGPPPSEFIEPPPAR